MKLARPALAGLRVDKLISAEQVTRGIILLVYTNCRNICVPNMHSALLSKNKFWKWNKMKQTNKVK